MINKIETPFAGLSPDRVLDAASSVGLDPDGRLFALNSYENRVYQLGSDEGTLILKFYRPARWDDAQILEEHRFTAEMAAAELPVAAPVAISGQTLFRYGEFRFAAFPYLRGGAPELDAPGARELLGRSIARLHQVGARSPFERRPEIGIERLGATARTMVLQADLLPEGLRDRYESVSGMLLERIEGAYREVGPVGRLRLHGDCHLGNLLWNEHGPLFVDLDDCAMGPRIQDLWMVLSGSPADQQAQWAALLTGYQQFADFDFRELRLVEPLRGLRMLHHAAWVCHRWLDPAFPRAFPWFGEARYWEGYLGDLREQIAVIDEPPLLAGL
ncbi:MAG TPA: serine/threonine protein kinase [Steroidobacteraceae bacterium]|jgi:Ser/Thr protein kinase RdoA (MazF antagonist)|nr:serine/threonine protein kinase [Steroidobacteraceae bacterium]